MNSRTQSSDSNLNSSIELPPPVYSNKQIPTFPSTHCDFEPFKLLYKCIHPQATLPNSSGNSSELLKSRKGSSIRFDKQQQQGIIIDINTIQSVCLTRMGLRNYDGMENQDVIFEDSISNKCRIFGIFDGHGEHGKIIAESARTIFKNLLQKYSEEIKNESCILPIETIVRKVLQKTNSYILHYKVEEAQFSGTTALVILLTPKKIYSFNIGNSRVVLGKKFGNSQRIEPFQLSHDHTIARFDERGRILKNGGVISPFVNQKGEQLGPERIWAKNESYPGMFVTRTLGLSCAYKIGVLAEPQMSVIDLRSCFHYIILGSDGFWSVQQNDEAVKFLERCGEQSLEKVAHSLMGQAVRRWNNKNVLMDDISLIIVALKQQ